MQPTVTRTCSGRFRSALTLFAMLLIGAGAAQAAPADEAVEEESAASEAPAPASSPQPPVRPQANSPDEFIPTEEIEEDRPVSYPSDI